jgi:hypothetical protein
VNRFVAPEMWAGKRCTEKIDVYAFAIILWMLMSVLHENIFTPYGCSPKNDWTLEELYERRSVLKGRRPEPSPKLEEYGKGLLDLMTACWKQEPTERPTSKSIVVCFSCSNLILDFIFEVLKLEVPSGFTLKVRGVCQPNWLC